MQTPNSNASGILADRIRSLLADRGLSLADVARRSRSGDRYGPLHHIPHNLYDAVRRRQFSPSAYQIEALSLLSGYRFVDWLQLFGFSLDSVLRFQVLFPALRTVELDTSVYHSRAEIPAFCDLAPGAFDAPLTPLSRWLGPTGFLHADTTPGHVDPAFRFVKIGSQDAFAFPDLLPGSIVRVNPALKGQGTDSDRKPRDGDFCLVEHGRGYVCSRTFPPDEKRILLCSKHLPYSCAELELGTQAKLVGTADMEFRRIVNSENPVVPKSLGGDWKPTALPAILPPGNVGEFLRRARRRSGLSFREASKRTQVIASALEDQRYFCAPGSLSDCETRKTTSRHIHKLISICAVFSASVRGCLEAAGVSLAVPGQTAMPARLLGADASVRDFPGSVAQSQFLTELERRIEGLPYFLFGSMPDFFQMPDLSLRDIFWAGGAERFIQPYLKGAIVLILDRRKKIPRSSLACPKWAQPLYVFLRRDGRYLCGSCVHTNGVLVIHPCTTGLPSVLRLRNRTDAEVVGQIVGVIRRLR